VETTDSSGICFWGILSDYSTCFWGIQSDSNFQHLHSCKK